MIITKGTKMLIHNSNRGVFYAKARRAFSLDDDHYPVVITDPLESNTVRDQEADLRAASTNIELLELETEFEIENEIQGTAESETETESDEVLFDDPELGEETAEGEVPENGVSGSSFFK